MANSSEVEKSLDEHEIRSEAEADDSYVNAALEDDDHTKETSAQPSYALALTETDIRERLRRDIQSVSDITSLSEAEATLLLSHWDVTDIHERWPADAKRLRETAGLLEPGPPSDENEFDHIGICGHSLTHENFASVSCGHRICTHCWTAHINGIINENPADEWNLLLKCPARVDHHAYCTASVGQDMVERFAYRTEKTKYDQQFLKSYVDSSKTMKWNPIRGSSCAVDLDPESANSNVSCLRLLRFCWNCKEEAHSPVDCIKAAEWVQEIMKPCPKCLLMIQRNQNFSLKMTCLPCNSNICWYCNEEYGEGTEGDLYVCYFCDVSISTDQRKKMEDCYENWKSYESLMITAEDNLKKLDIDIEKLSNTQLPTKPQLKFILEAGLQIIEFTRFLKWTYVYGCYLISEDEVGKQNILRQSQEDTKKSLLGTLEDCLKTDLPPLLDAEGPSESFNSFRIKLTEQTRIVREQYENMVDDLENGLASVVSASERTRTANDGEASGSSHTHDD